MKMFAHCAGILLLVLHATNSQGNQVKTVEVPLGGTVNISCEISALPFVVTWYKEGQNKNLCKIDQDDNNLKGEQKSTSYFSNLIINNAQRNASGTYTCVVNQNYGKLPLPRTRVIITETLKPTLSILGPSFLQDGPLKHDIPLLCIIFNVNPNSNTVTWNISGKIYQDKKDADMIDGKGAFSIWSLKLIPPEDWQSEMSYACSYPGSMTTGGVLNRKNHRGYIFQGMQLTMALPATNYYLTPTELIGSKHLSVLLKDEIFTDFFNTFLNLPVFGQTPLFICRTRQWYLWPELPCNQVSKHKGLLNWMEKHRLPFFCKTNLFLHYVLCEELVSFIRSPEAAEMLRWRKADQWLLEKCIAGSRGMWRFRSFMQGMAGEELTKFWLAAERILGIDETDESQQDLYVSLIQILMATHLQEGSTVVTLCNTTVESLLKKTPFHRQHVQTRREILHEMQKVALFKIESYWLPNFFIHCKLSMEDEPKCLHLLKKYQDRSLHMGMQRQKALALPPMSIRESSLDTKSYYSLKNKRELWDQIRGRSLSHKAKKKDGRSQKPKSYKGSPVPKKLTFSRKSFSSPSPHHKELIWDSEDVTSFDESPNFKCSPNEFLTSPVSDEFPDKCTYNKLRSSTPVVQFPSMLALKTLIKSPPCLDFLPWVLTADKCAGRPFREFLLRRNYAVEVHLLDLWHDLEDFLRMMLCSLGEGNILLRHVMGERICELYLTQSNNWHLPLKLTTLQSLQNLLPSGHVIPWVLKAQKEVCKILSFLYEEFLQNDDKMFLYYVSGKEKKPNAEEPYDRTENLRLIRRIVESLHLSQALAGMRDIDLLTRDHWQLLGIQDLTTGGSIFMELEPVVPQMDYGSMTFEELARLNPKMAVELLSKNFREFCKRCPSGKVFVRPVVPKRSLQWARSSFSFLRKATVRKPISKPRTLSEVMQNSLHFEYFRNFLRLHNAEAPLLFCLTVEDIKKELDPRIQQMQINECVRTYFFSPIPPEKLLHCDEYVIREIPKLPSVHLPILVTAQMLVLRILEEKWFNMYQGLYPDSDIAIVPTGWKSKKDSPFTSKQKRCWCILTAFIRRVCKFRKAMSYVGQRKRFENFLLKEVKNDKENIQSPTQTKPAIQSGFSGRSGPSSGPSEEPELQQVKRRLPGGRIISVNFLVNDLYFYLEMERFLHLSDTVVMLASLGFYTERDIAFLKSKVTTISKLFLNSDIPPKLRVNLTDAQCIQIRTLISEGVMNRTLYHGAIIAIFPHLLYFWKKYCYWKVMKYFRKRKGEKTDESPLVLPFSPTKTPRRSSGFSGEDHPIIRFTLLKGIQLLLPQPREATDELPGEKSSTGSETHVKSSSGASMQKRLFHASMMFVRLVKKSLQEINQAQRTPRTQPFNPDCIYKTLLGVHS